MAINALQVTQVGFIFRLLPWDRRSFLPIGGVTALALCVFPIRQGFGGTFGWLAPLVLFAVGCVVLFVAWGTGGEEAEVWRVVRSRLRGRFAP